MPPVPDRTIAVGSQAELESAVVELCAGLMPEGGEALRAQVRGGLVIERSFSGAGFFTTYRTPVEVAGLPPGAARLGLRPTGEGRGVCVAASGPTFPEGGAGFALHAPGGRIGTLEGFTFAGPWPSDLAGASVHYAEIALGGGAVA